MAELNPSSHSLKSDAGHPSHHGEEEPRKSLHVHKYPGASPPQSGSAPAASSLKQQGGRKYFDSTDKKVEAGAAGAADGSSSPAQGSNKTHVLLVEDVAISQRVARVALSRARFKVDVATDGETAVDRYKKGPFGIVLMDIHLPKMDGTQATEQIRAFEAERGLPPAIVFALSGSSEPSDLERYRSVGMNGCIAKGNVLADTLREALAEFEKDPTKFVVRNLD